MKHPKENRTYYDYIVVSG